MSMEEKAKKLWSPLHRAVRDNDQEKVLRLFKRRTSLDEKEEAICDYTPLGLAVSRGNIPMTILLLRMGANPEKGNNYLSAWEIAKKDKKLLEVMEATIIKI